MVLYRHTGRTIPTGGNPKGLIKSRSVLVEEEDRRYPQTVVLVEDTSRLGGLMKFCQTCGAQIHKDAVICPECGVPCPGMERFANNTKQSVEQREGQDAANSSLMFAGIGGLLLLIALFIPGWGLILQIGAAIISERGRRYSVRAEDLGWYTGNAKAGRILCIIVNTIAWLGIIGNILLIIFGVGLIASLM